MTASISSTELARIIHRVSTLEHSPEVFVNNADVGRVVITYLEDGYRHPVPMIDQAVMEVSADVALAFEAGSMFGWHVPASKAAHQYVALLLAPAGGEA